MKRGFGIGRRERVGRVDEEEAVDVLKKILTLVRAI